MKTKILLLIASLMVVIGCFFPGCATTHDTFKITVEPVSGAPGEIVVIGFESVKPDGSAMVKFGREPAMIAKSTDEGLAVMVPPMAAAATRISVSLGQQRASAAFEVISSGTVRLWFSLKGPDLRFVESQPSREEFRQDKSYSTRKLMYELVNARGAQVAIGYISDPTDLEVPLPDKQGLSRVTLTEEVKFSINVPAFTNLARVRISRIDASSDYQPRLIGEVAIK